MEHQQIDSSEAKERQEADSESLEKSDSDEEATERKGQGMKNNSREGDADDASDDEQSTHDKHDSDKNSDNESDTSKNSEIESQNKQKKKKKKQKEPVGVGENWLAETDNFNAKLKKRGVVYVARVPPRMTPTKMKSLLSEFGEVTRIYLVEEDKTARQRRRKQGGSGSKRYTEGWVEFAKKRVAKHVAQSLNTTPISNQKRNSHCGDLWALKYLRKFKWSHLTEKVAYERRVREQKLRVEMMQARRENASYVELVETGKKLDRIEERKRKRMEKDPTTTNNSSKEDEMQSKNKKKRHQKQPREDQANAATKRALLQSLV